jgi:hypothetical protein
LSKYVLPASGTYSYALRSSYLKEATTGIEQLPSMPQSEATGDTSIYNIQGVVVGSTTNPTSLPKGIYIANGKKFIVK